MLLAARHIGEWYGKYICGRNSGHKVVVKFADQALYLAIITK